MLKFDDATAQLLETAYLGADFARRRRANFDALNAKAGEVVADLGCGNGMLSVELARAVGPLGRMIGVDFSDEMRELAKTRCADMDQAQFVAGNLQDIPLDDQVLDRAVSVQVFEYLDDLPRACSECARILKPGGRLVVGDMHFDTLAWHSANPERMDRLIRSWDHHFTQRAIPAVLPPILEEAGFVMDRIIPVTFVDHSLRADGIALVMLNLMSNYAEQNGLMPSDEVQAWREEQHELAQSGGFFFSLTHFILVAHKKP